MKQKDIKFETLGSVASYVNGRAFKPSEWERSGLPIIRIQNLNDPQAKYNYSSVKHDKKFLIKKGDLLFAWSASLGAHIWKGNDAWLNQHIFHVIPTDNINTLYLYYYLCQVVSDLYAKTHGSGMVHITKAPFMATPVPVPPLPEQERIVARIEELFSELDKAVETLKTTKHQLAIYRQAVLKEAFSSPCNMVQVSSLCNVVRGGSPRPAGSDKYYNGPIPFLKVADLTRNDGMYLNEFTYTIKPEGLTKTRKVPANTLLLSNSGATLGVPKICTFETTFNDGVAAFLDFDLTQQYLPYHYYFWLSKLPEMRAIDQGAAQPNLNTTIIGEVEIPQHNFEEQKQISNMIEARLSVCDSIEKTVDSVLAQADAMRQSILKQAFEGRL